MAPTSERSRIRRTLWIAAALCVLAVAIAVALAEPGTRRAVPRAGIADVHASPLRPLAPLLPMPSVERNRSQAPEPSSLNTLRDDAAIGNPYASQLLVMSLLDRYDRSGDSDDLFEAMQWFDRNWGADRETYPDVTARIYAHYCDHRVLRWHWLCLAGE